MRARLVLVVFILLSSACGIKIPPPPDVSGLQVLDVGDSKVALDEIRVHGKQVHSLRGRLKATMKGSLGEERLTQVTVFERPDRLRMEFFATSLNKLTALLITRRGSMHAVDPINMRVYRGPASLEAVSRLLPVPFTSSDIMLWLVGRIDPPKNKDLLNPSVHTGDNSLVVHYSLDDGRKFVAQFEPSRTAEEFGKLRLQSFEVRGRGDRRLLVSRFVYPEVIPGNEPLIPESISFWIPEESLIGELRYEEREINPDLAKDRGKLFLGRTPAGATIIDLSDKNSVSKIERFM